MDDNIIKELAESVLNQSTVNNQIIRCLADIAKLLPAPNRDQLLDDLQKLIDRAEKQSNMTVNVLRKIYPEGDIL